MADWFRMDSPGCTYIDFDKVECLDIRLDGVTSDTIIIPRISALNQGEINIGPGTPETFEQDALDWLKDNTKVKIKKPKN